MSSYEHPFGKIVVHKTDYTPVEVIRITGISNVSPNFINKIDENLWSKHWREKSALFKIDYIHSQDRFDKDKKEMGSWSQEEVKEFTKIITNLTESYNKSAKLYNSKIAEKFIKERKGLLDKIL